MIKYINFVMIMEDSAIVVETGFSERRMRDLFKRLQKTDDASQVTLEEGIQRLREYFEMYWSYASQEEKTELNDLIEQFKLKVKGLKGKFVIWGIEYDQSLTFVRE